MAKKRAALPQDKDLEVDMSPMIDMVFLLLIFFVVTANALQIPIDNEVKVSLATNARAQEDKDGRIVINIRSNGDFFDVDVNPLSTDDAIVAYLEAQFNLPSNQRLGPDNVKLHLRGDETSLYKHANKAMTLASKAGILHVAFAAQSE